MIFLSVLCFPLNTLDYHQSDSCYLRLQQFKARQWWLWWGSQGLFSLISSWKWWSFKMMLLCFSCFDSFCFFINDSRIQLKHRITDSLINLWFPDFWFDEKVLISHQGKVAVVVHQGEVFRHQLLHLQQKFLFHYQIVRRPKEFLNMPLLANPLRMVHSKIREEM